MWRIPSPVWFPFDLVADLTTIVCSRTRLYSIYPPNLQYTAASREPVQIPNILEERTYAPRMRQMLERFGFRASLAVPLLREDRIIGGLVVRRKSTGQFRPEVISF